jgi:hypothetical protein
MRSIALALLLVAGVAQAQAPDEAAFARLPAEIQALLRHLPPREALQKVTIARQNLIALGMPEAGTERLRSTVEAVLSPREAAVRSVSAGQSSFPPLSPLVAPVAYEAR